MSNNLYYDEILEQRRVQEGINLFEQLGRLPSRVELRKVMTGDQKIWMVWNFLKSYKPGFVFSNPQTVATELQLMEEFRDIALRLNLITLPQKFYANSRFNFRTVHRCFKTLADFSLAACNHFSLNELIANNTVLERI